MEAVLEKPKHKKKKKAKASSNDNDQTKTSQEESFAGPSCSSSSFMPPEQQATDQVADCPLEKLETGDIKDHREETANTEQPPKAVEQKLLSEDNTPIVAAEKLQLPSNSYTKLLHANQEIMNSLKLTEIGLESTGLHQSQKNAYLSRITTKEPVAAEHSMQAYTEQQLAALYTNTELEAVQHFASQFVEAELKGCAMKRNLLYELLESYLKARSKATGNSLECEQLQQEYKEIHEQVWSMESVVVGGRGQCRCGNVVRATHTYNKATFHRSVFQTVGRILASLQTVITEQHVLYSYLVEVSRLQIELYLQTLIENCLNVSGLHVNASVSLLTHTMPPNVVPILLELRLSISTLFSFQRRLIRDTEFIKQSRNWLKRLVAILLRLSNWQDHLFILHQVLRCPAGVGSWAAEFIQTPLTENLQESPFSSYQINHIVAVLSAILMPVQKREQFLEQLAQSKENPDESLWVVIDSEGEEDEESSGTALRENDLVQLLNQLPLDNLFRAVLLIDHYDEKDFYEPHRITENHILRFIAFATILLKILRQGLYTYDQPRYHQFSKRLCRLIRHIVQYATDLWEQFQDFNKSMDPAMLKRLQVEYDAFFLRATLYLYSAQKLGAWQFLAVVPYHLVSSKALWRIFYFLHDTESSAEMILNSTDDMDFKQRLWDESLRSQFEDKLCVLNVAESYYLLNTFANMALARKESDMSFIQLATMDLLEVGFVTESTQENCSKNARILLTHITSKYPSLLSDILMQINNKFSYIGSLSLYLFEDLPLSVWQPSENDMRIIASWLIKSEITTDESRLARMILSRLNWGLTSAGALFLPYQLHYNVALMLAEIVEQEPGYLQWAWQTAYRLRLHFNDKGLSDLSRVADLDNVSIINTGVREQKPFFCFLALLMTSCGHLVPLVCTKGLLFMENLQTHQKHDAILFALNLIVPLFLDCQESLINCEKFQNILIYLLNADRTYINMAKSLVVSQNFVLEQFGSIIDRQINSFHWYNLDSPRCLVRLWMNSLVSIPNWNKDQNVLSLLDIIIRAAFMHGDALDAAVGVFRDLLQCSTPQENSTSISSLFKWASQSTLPQGSLLTATSLPSHVWLAYILIWLEHEEREKQTGLWREITMQLRNQKGKINVDAAIKKAASIVKVPSFTSSSLCIYRWAQQALDTPVDHPLLALLWQKFFTLYLERPPVSYSSDNGCIGYKLFDGFINLNFFKRLKKRLQETVEFYQKKTEDCDKNGENLPRKQFYLNCHRVFRAYSLWLEEPRLQVVDLYLPNLPPQYEPQRLDLIIQGNGTPWLECLNYELVKEEQQKLMKAWRMSVYREKSNVNQPLQNPGRGMESGDPTERILRRLTSYDAPKSAPPIIKAAPVIPAINITDKASTMNVLAPHIRVLQKFAFNHNQRVLEHKALDSTYKELLPQLYRSVLRKVKKEVVCKRSTSESCAGPAVIMLEANEARMNERIDHQIQANRNDYELLINKTLQAPAQALCVSSVTIQTVIDILSTRLKLDPSVSEMGVELFYHMFSLVDKDINFYPPAKQCFVSCLEKLGQNFICGVEYETPRLLNKILEESLSMHLLVPHFSPVNVGTVNFLHMYSTICSNTGERYELIFPLLSKFDISVWLTVKQPKLSQRTQFIEMVIKVLAALKLEPPSESLLLHEVYRKHLLCMFEYQFPEHYGDVLMTLLKASIEGQSGSVAVSVWMDILNSLSRPIKLKQTVLPRDHLRHYAQQQRMLCYQELLETTRLLATHFSEQRLHYNLFGAYPTSRSYIDVFATFTGMVGHALIISSLNTHQGLLGDKLCEKIWPYLKQMFDPWILPYYVPNIKDTMPSWIQQTTSDKTILMPWIPADGPFAQKMVHIFFECVLFIIHTLPASNNILSYIWEWYGTGFAYQGVKDYVLNTVHASFFQLPWQNFWPSMNDLELMLKIVEQYLPECHVFLGHIFVQVSWANWMKHVSGNIALRVHQCLLHLLVKLSNEPNVRTNHSEKVRNLLVQAEYFNWDLIDPGIYHQIIDWYVMSCDPLVLCVTDPLDLDFRVLHFLKVVAGYHKIVDNHRPNSLQKRHLYVRSFVKLFSILTGKHKTIVPSKINQLKSVIVFNLNHMEAVVKDEEEFCVLLNDMFGLVNIDGLKKHIACCFEQWLSIKPADSVGLIATLRTLAASVIDIEATTTLYEVAVNSYFLNNASQTTNCWKNLASTIKPYAPRQAELEHTLVTQGRLLTLHAFLLQKVATCTDSFALLNTILQWLGDIKLNTMVEEKLPLLWLQTLHLAMIHGHIDQPSAGAILYKFSQILLQSSTEKGVSGWGKGLLGAIGIVKQDTVSLKFRFLSRALAGYVLAQLPDTKGALQTVRCAANAPGTVGQPGGNTECSKILLGLDFGQSQGEIKTCAELALKQIQDSNNSMHNATMFLSILVGRLYTKPYLKDIYKC